MKIISKISLVFILLFSTVAVYSQCETYLQKGDVLFSQKKYEEARKQYLGYKECKPNATGIEEIIVKIDSILSEQKTELEKAENESKYQNAIVLAERNFKQRQYEQAEQNYKTALGFKPENAAYINAKIEEIDRKKNEPAILYIYRKSFWKEDGQSSTYKYNIFLDNNVICESKNSLKKPVTVTTFGTKTISAIIENRKAEVKINFEPGGVYYVRSSVKSDTRNTGKYKTVTSTVYKSEGSIFKGTYKSVPAGTKTETVPVTETYYTPILQLVDKNVGAFEYNDIKDKK